MQGRRYVSANLAELLLSDLDGDNDQPLHRRLSEREFQIFCKLAAGRAVSSIADELCLSVKTVSTYRTRILEKMSLATNADITTYALQERNHPVTMRACVCRLMSDLHSLRRRQLYSVTPVTVLFTP